MPYPSRVAGILGALAIATAIMSPVEVRTTAAAGEPPCIPSPSIPPSFGDQCGQNPEIEVKPAESHYEVDMPVPPPVEDGHSAGNAIARFSVPVHPGVGVLRIGSFISTKYVPPPGTVTGYGNDRGFDSNFDANQTKLTLELNFKTGEGTAWATPSCALVTAVTTQGIGVEKTHCHSALPLDGSGTGSQLNTGIKNHSDSTDLRIVYAAKQSFTEGILGLRSFVTRINGDITVIIGNDNSLCVSGYIDQYPSVEMYLYTPHSGVMTLYQSKESNLGPEICLSPAVEQRQVLKCTGRIY